jgi:hypothetical protein
MGFFTAGGVSVPVVDGERVVRIPIVDDDPFDAFIDPSNVDEGVE